MADLTNYSEQNFLNHFFNSNVAKPTQINLSWSELKPNEDGVSGFTEHTWNLEPTRKALVFTAAANDGEISNNAELTWDSTGSGNKTVGYALIWDNSTGGNLLAWIELNGGVALTVNDGEPLRALANALEIHFKDGSSPNIHYPQTVRERWLNHWFGTTTDSTTPAEYIGLFNGDPSSGGTEMSGGSYQRQQVDWNAPASSTGDFTKVDFTGDVTFADCPNFTIDHWSVHTLQSGGEVLARREQGSVTVNAGDNAVGQSGQLLLEVN